MGALLAVGAIGIVFLAGLSLATSLREEFSGWLVRRRLQRFAGEGRLVHSRPLALRSALMPFSPLPVEHAVAAYYALHNPLWVEVSADDPPVTPDVLRTLLGSPGDGTVARFDAEGGFSEN